MVPLRIVHHIRESRATSTSDPELSMIVLWLNGDFVLLFNLTNHENYWHQYLFLLETPQGKVFFDYASVDFNSAIFIHRLKYNEKFFLLIILELLKIHYYSEATLSAKTVIPNTSGTIY